MRLTDIDLRLLRVFKAVAEAGGFVKAQAELGISQPAISSHIANLEQRLNVRLCNRGRQGFSLTPEGEQVLTETEQLLSHLDSYAIRLNEIGQKTEALVRVGVVDCLVTDANNPLSEIMRDAQAQFENLHFRIGVYDYLDCLTELRAGRLDFAFVGMSQGERVPNDFEAGHVYDEVSGLFCAGGHACAKTNDLGSLDALLKESKISAHSFLLNPIDEDLDMRLLDEKSEQSQGNIETTTYLTLAGSHVGLIPVHFADFWTTEGRLVELAPERYRVISEIHVLRLNNQPQETAVQWFWEKCMK
ncbi:LysR family transcriptional regulator [Sulfitobacter mediterraneus]|uniref:LysR family transcriptional regulator n=1 Tax=Sulfitobacter mediterraneus TaxID=83219 RepID=UPI0021A58E34|nr:LysR family transcriptional regulator [Sulfitobacter mediterraneus]UWR12151.1 LysR family transcriptional regulator [Sulfitobacter mediterraneus]